MEKKKANRSVLRTRGNLKTGLYTLLLQKPANEITVRELSERAKINRGTFYLHYRDIFDMISQIEEELFQEFTVSLQEMEEKQLIFDDLSILSVFFSFAQKNAMACKALMGPHGDAAFLKRFQSALKERLWIYMEGKGTCSREDFSIFYAFTSGGLVSLIREWINEPESSTERMADLASQMAQAAAAVFIQKRGAAEKTSC